jgi:hypothetical protein
MDKRQTKLMLQNMSTMAAGNLLVDFFFVCSSIRYVQLDNMNNHVSADQP